MAACCGSERNCSKSYSTCVGAGRGVCVPCGGLNEACCAEDFCKPGGICANMVCGPAASLVSPLDDDSSSEPY
jgi:hypothetical protein